MRQCLVFLFPFTIHEIEVVWRLHSIDANVDTNEEETL